MAEVEVGGAPASRPRMASMVKADLAAADGEVGDAAPLDFDGEEWKLSFARLAAEEGGLWGGVLEAGRRHNCCC